MILTAFFVIHYGIKGEALAHGKTKNSFSLKNNNNNNSKKINKSACELPAVIITVFGCRLPPNKWHRVVLEIQPSSSQLSRTGYVQKDVGRLIYLLLFVLRSGSQSHTGAGVCHLIAPSLALCPPSRPRLRFSTPVIPFLINIAEPLDSPKSFFIISRHCRGCKGQRHPREASLLRPVGMDSLQTAFSFCSCDGLALSWLQMSFLPS